MLSYAHLLVSARYESISRLIIAAMKFMINLSIAIDEVGSSSVPKMEIRYATSSAWSALSSVSTEVPRRSMRTSSNKLRQPVCFSNKANERGRLHSSCVLYARKRKSTAVPESESFCSNVDRFSSCLYSSLVKTLSQLGNRNCLVISRI